MYTIALAWALFDICTGDRNTILFPVLFLAAVRQAITKLLIHYTCNSTGRSHPMKQMWSAIFSFFYNRKITVAAFRTGIIYAVDLNYFQFCRYKDQFTTYKRFADLYQCSITNRTELILFRNILIFLKRISCGFFPFFWRREAFTLDKERLWLHFN